MRHRIRTSSRALLALAAVAALALPYINWTTSTPGPGAERIRVYVRFAGILDCNFTLSASGHAYLIDPTEGARNQDQDIRDGGQFAFASGTGGTSEGAGDVDGRVFDGAREAEIGLGLHLSTLDGTLWGGCGELPDGLRYLSPCDGIDTTTLDVTVGSGVFDTGLAPFASLPLPRNVLGRAAYGASHHDHASIDLPVGIGTAVYAVKPGTVSYVGTDCGLGIQVTGYDGGVYRYCHLSSRWAQPRTVVLAGDQIGLSGDTDGSKTGHSGRPHLHVQVSVNGPSDLRCPQTMRQAIYDGVTPPNPANLPATGCYYASKAKVQLNKTAFNIGEAPVYTVTDGEPNYPIYWSSTLNGVPVEDFAFYGRYTDANGNWTGTASAFAGGDVGTWTKTVHINDDNPDPFVATFTVNNVSTPPPPSAALSIDKTSFATGETPHYTVSHAAPNSPIYWSSTRNGAGTGESNAFYGQYTDGNGNWSGTGAAWTNNDAGSWTKTVTVHGQNSSVAFQVTVPAACGYIWQAQGVLAR